MSEPTNLQDAAQDDLHTLERDFQTARDDLAHLERDLATLVSLADGHELGYERLREANAPMHARVEIKAQLSAARELMLEQNEAITDARARVSSLEQAAMRAAAIKATSDLASDMRVTQETLESDLTALEDYLNERLEPIYAHIGEWRAQRKKFKELLGQLGITHYPNDAQSNVATRHEQFFDALLSDLESRGVQTMPLRAVNQFVGDWREMYGDFPRPLPQSISGQMFTNWVATKEHALRLAAQTQAEEARTHED